MLAESQEGEEVKIIGVKNHSSEFLAYLDELDIALGSTIKTIKINEFDQSHIVVINKQKHSISKEVANNLFTKTLAQ